MHILLRLHKRIYSDIDVVIGLQKKDRNVEDWFYKDAKVYFMEKFHEVFFDEDQRNEIFHDSVIRLWTQIENRKIAVVEGIMCRRDDKGKYQQMTCSLHTFLMAIAKNEYRELIRNNKELYVDRFFENDEYCDVPEHDEKNIAEFKAQIVDECIMQMPPRCKEILTLFYVEGKSLDEIMMARKDKNISKVGLKTAKYKCMNSLRDKVLTKFNMLNL